MAFLPIGQLEIWYGCMCLFMVIWFIISILIGVWVYQDAESRGMGGVLWLIVVLVGGIIGLIIYLIVKKEKEAVTPAPARITRICPKCGRVISERVNYCPYCGTSLPASETPVRKHCPHCGAEVSPGAVFCDSCGSRLHI